MYNLKLSQLILLPFFPVFLGMFSAPAVAQPAERFEVSALKTLRPTFARWEAACEKGDVAGARAAYEDFQTGWKGIQVYVIMRDRNVFQLEGNLELKIATALKSPQPNLAIVLADVKTLAARYDALVVTTSRQQPLNPLFDDVARLRIARAKMREVDLALRAKDFSRARAGLATFSGEISGIKPILVQRSPETWAALTKEFPVLQAEVSSPNPNVEQCLAHIRAIMSKYTRTITALTREAAQTA